MMYKIINTFVPQYLTKLYHINFVPRCIDIVLGTDSLSLPKCSTSFTQQSFIHHAARVWYTVPSNIQSSFNVNLFKFNLKKCLLSKFLNS